MSHHIDQTIDLRDLDSPIPTIRTKETLDAMPSGQVLKVLTNRESTVKNIRTLVANQPYTLLAFDSNKSEYIFLIKKD